MHETQITETRHAHSGTSGVLAISSIPLNLIHTTCYTWPGHHIHQRFSHQHRRIEESISGISVSSDRSRHQTTQRMDLLNFFSCMEVKFVINRERFSLQDTGHTAPPTDFCWAPGESETWTLASSSEDNIAMVWSPSMRIWAGEDVDINPKHLEPGEDGSAK